MQGIGIDFGTTNSVIAVADAQGAVHALQWPNAVQLGENSAALTDTARTALAFRPAMIDGLRSHTSAAGSKAIAWALDPSDSQRFVQSIKTHLGSHAFRETRIFGAKFLLEDLIALFLRHLVAEGALPGGAAMPKNIRIAAGRPVVFAGDRVDEALALQRLQAAYASAGLDEPEFVFEPLGAAYWYARNLKDRQVVLVADFGGGTSDFSVMEFVPNKTRLEAKPLAHAGVGIAGDTFDYRIIDQLISPQLGKTSLYRSLEKRLPVPQHFYAAFARWHQLSWLKSPRTIADLEAISDTAEEPEKLSALRTMIDHDLGLELYQAVTQAKMRLSEHAQTALVFDRSGVRLSADVKRQDFEAWINDDLIEINNAMLEAIRAAGLIDADIDAVFMTGGTSYVPSVRRLFTKRFGETKIHIGNAFQSVASGLALVARDRVRLA